MSNRINKLNQLDSIRAFAALLIAAFHLALDFNLGTIHFGWIGVDVFFVISGYLITAILLEQKSDITNKLLIVKNFIIKRALRLFPVFYLFISFFYILMKFFNLYVWDSGNEIYYYTYTQNILFFKEGMKGIQVNHLWSLAVEEQFYLVWPWLIVFISNKKLLNTLLIIIPLTLFFKSFYGNFDYRMLPFYHLDTLGGGALFALIIKENKEKWLLFVKKVAKIVLPIALIILVAIPSINKPNLLINLSVLVLSISLLINCYNTYTGVFGKILNIPQLNYLGKISYGIYVYHKPIPYFVKLCLTKTNLHINSTAAFIFSFLLTIIIAHISFQILEKPFLKLKDKFDL